jgi:galactitol-specific phosphotransferase system IIB component
MLNHIFLEKVLNNKKTLKALQNKGVDCSTIVTSKYSILASGKEEDIIMKTEHIANGYEKSEKQKKIFFNMIKDTLKQDLDIELN